MKLVEDEVVEQVVVVEVQLVVVVVVVVVDSEGVKEKAWFVEDLNFLLFLPLEEPALAKDTTRNKRIKLKMRIKENFSWVPWSMVSLTKERSDLFDYGF